MGNIRCQMETERGKQVQTQWDEADIIFVPTVCVKINLQTALGWKPQEDSSLSKQKGMMGVQTHWTSAGLDLHWSPWQLYKKAKPSTSLWRSDVGQDPSAYTGMSVGVWCFSRRGGTASFQPLNGKKQMTSWRVKWGCFSSYWNLFTLRRWAFFWAFQSSYLSCRGCRNRAT